MDNFILIFIIFSIQVFNFITKVTILQNQYYSIKRYFIYVKEKRKVLFLISICLIALSFLLITRFNLFIIFYIFPFVVFKVKLLKNIKITKRIVIQFIALLSVLMLNIVFSDNIYIILAYNLFSFWISFFISLCIEKIKQKYYIKLANKKIKQYKVKIIAITGSYGKTSCKNYIYEILKVKYNVLISPHSYNTLNGILLTINKQLKPFHNYLILEIGVDSKNGMNKFIKNFAFDYCAVTCIGPQHLKTFKTIENIAIEKSKLLKVSNIASFYNIDDDYILKNNIIDKGITFSCSNSADVLVKQIKNNKLTIKIFNNYYITTSSLLGKHNLSNLALSIAVCKKIGMEDAKIIDRISKIKNVEHRLSLFYDKNWTIIDDSYNSNVDGFLNALDVLNQFDGYKIIITPGIIETSKKENFDLIISQKINSVTDLALLIKFPSFFKYVDNKLSFYSFKEAYTYLKNNYIDKKLSILIENDLPEIFLR